MNRFIENFASWHLQSRPEVNIGKCIGCAACNSACPPKAIGMFPWIPRVEVPPKTGEPRARPEINYQDCSRCYRCQAICPRQAIETHEPWLMKILKM